MTEQTLQARFEQALRRALSGATEAGTSVVHVESSAPVVNVSPVIKATLPALDGPLEVLDVGRQNGAYEFRMRVARNAQGQITDAVVSPEKFHPLESFK